MPGLPSARELECFERALPERHRINRRGVIENVEGWYLLGHDRRRPEYTELYERSCTPLQIAQHLQERGFVSLLTPSLLTRGYFELYHGAKCVRFRCYGCAYKHVRGGLDLLLPRPCEWMVYMLLESVGYLRAHSAPREGPPFSCHPPKHRGTEAGDP